MNQRKRKVDIAVVGAGIAGIAAAHALVRAGARSVALIESGAPLSLTSDKSTECYRNFWPGPDDAMAVFMRRSIEQLQALSDASANRFQLHQRGYLFATARTSEIESLAAQAQQNQQFGGGELRIHQHGATRYQTSPSSGYDHSLNGADLILDKAAIQRHFSYLAPDTAGVLHARNCGVLSAQQLGMLLLEEARAAGVDYINAEFCGVQTTAGKLAAIELTRRDELLEIETHALVLATGPHLRSCAAQAGAELPVLVEKHVKISLSDKRGAMPRDAPLTIWNDPTDLAWTPEERELLAASAQTQHLTETFPAGVHGRPVGAGDQIYIYWTYDCPVSQTPEFPIEGDPHYPEILLRGMARMIPDLAAYFDPMPRAFVDGGYYTKAADNRPLIGPLETPGTFACGAFSGYGIMASCAAGELLASHVLGRPLPSYAPAFLPGRLHNAAYMAKVRDLAGSGQI